MFCSAVNIKHYVFIFKKRPMQEAIGHRKKSRKIENKNERNSWKNRQKKCKFPRANINNRIKAHKTFYRATAPTRTWKRQRINGIWNDLNNKYIINEMRLCDWYRFKWNWMIDHCINRLKPVARLHSKQWNSNSIDMKHNLFFGFFAFYDLSVFAFPFVPCHLSLHILFVSITHHLHAIA